MSFLNFMGTVYYVRTPPPQKNENKQSTASKRENQMILNHTNKIKDKSILLKQAFPFAKFLAENL